MKKIYIAGKVTGIPHEERFQKFFKAEKQLLDAGFFGINPLKLVKNPDEKWHIAMKICIKALMGVDGVLLLPCASASKGARIERILASWVKIPIYTDIIHLKNNR
jgi:hypothetical protein